MLKDKIGTFAARAALATGGTAVGAGGIASTFGLSAVAHSSGAMIGTIGGSYASGTIGTVAAGVLGTVSAPALIAIGAGVASCGGLYFAHKQIKRLRSST